MAVTLYRTANSSCVRASGLCFWSSGSCRGQQAHAAAVQLTGSFLKGRVVRPFAGEGTAQGAPSRWSRDTPPPRASSALTWRLLAPEGDVGQQQNAPENMCAEVGRTPRSSLMSLAVLPPATRHSSLGHFPGQQPVLSPAVGGPEQAGEGGRRASLGDASLLGPWLAPHLASPWPSCNGGRRGCSPASPPVLPLETAPPPHQAFCHEEQQRSSRNSVLPTAITKYNGALNAGSGVPRAVCVSDRTTESVRGRSAPRALPGVGTALGSVLEGPRALQGEPSAQAPPCFLLCAGWATAFAETFGRAGWQPPGGYIHPCLGAESPPAGLSVCRSRSLTAR